MSEELSTAVSNFSSASTPRYRWQQAAAGNHPQQAELLEKLEQTCLKLGRPPNREELVPALRIELNAVFGFLHSALLQLGWTPFSMPVARGFHRKRRKQKKTGWRTGSI